MPREEFLSAFEEQVAVLRRQEEIQAELEACGSDMERMAPILDELDALSKQARHPDPNPNQTPYLALILMHIKRLARSYEVCTGVVNGGAA